MAYTQTQLDALDKAIAEGVLIVKYQDKTVTYRSLDEMLRIRDLMTKDLGQQANASGIVYPSFSKGLC